jgi:UDP-glucuronate 4-epimerase
MEAVMTSAPQTILVSGTGGFIGFHVARRLLAAGHRVIGVDSFNDYYIVALKEARSAELKRNPLFEERRCDIADASAFARVFDEFQVDLLCHLAAQAGVRHSIEHPRDYTHSNIEAFLNVLEMARRRKSVKRLVYASSSSVYGGNKKVPFAETDSVDLPLSLYAATKRANELMAHSYGELYGLRSVGLRFFSVYGPWGRPDMAMWLFAESMLAGKPINVYNNGLMRRDFTYVDDIVSGVCGALFAEGLGRSELFNLGNHRCEDLLKIISIIETHLKVRAKMNFLPMQMGDVPESFADVEHAREKLSFEPSTPVEKGIPAFLDWYLANPALAQAASAAR